MKILLLTVLLLLCSTQVLTLTCYTCLDENDNVCIEETECEPSANFCKTVEREGEIISRTCEATCTDDPTTYCCNESFC